MMKPWEKGSLQVAENKKYLKNGQEPFFWMGDTAWLLFQKCSREEAYDFLRNRKEKGFSVIQAVFFHPETKSRKAGSIAATSAGSIDDGAYWAHCDEIISCAEELGLYMGLLPAWGSAVRDRILTDENMPAYITKLVQRYKDRPNIIWLLGGDVRGSVAPELFNRAGELIKELSPGQLVGFHPFGRTSSSYWFADSPWLDFHMFQSGHRRYDQASLGAWDDNAIKEGFKGEDNWLYVRHDAALPVLKPTLDGEPSYEQIPQGLHDPSQPRWQAWDVRRYAYWSVLEGAMGHTYGSNAIMQFHTGKGVGAYGAEESWQEAMHHSGSGHMKHLVDLMESVDYWTGIPAEGLLVGGQKEKYERISVFAGKDFVLAYDYLGNPFSLDLSQYAGREADRFWFDPSSGTYSFIDRRKASAAEDFTPVRRFSQDNDWVLVIRFR